MSHVTPDALAFLDPIDQICEERTPDFLRATHLLVVALFLSLLTVGALVQVDVVVTGPGRLVTETPPIVLQPLQQAILREISVKPGQVVSKGDVVATLDPTFAQADQVSLSGQLHALQSQIWRLEAEAGDRDPLIEGTTDPANALQLALHRQRQAEYQSRVRTFNEDISRLAATLKATRDTQAALSRQLEITRSVEAVRGTLLAHQTGSRLQYLDAEALRMRAEQDLQEATNRLPELQHAILSRAAERQSFIDSWRREISETLFSTRAEAAKVAEALSKSSMLKSLVVVTAPEDGVVLEVAQKSGGSVLLAAEPLVTMTPSHATLIAEVMIGSHEVGDLLPGADATVKVDAFPYQAHGVLTGHLLSVSQESFPVQGGSAAFHRARIELAGTHLDRMPAHSHLFPGLTLVAEIKVGSRNALSYFLTPLTRGFQESLREP